MVFFAEFVDLSPPDDAGAVRDDLWRTELCNGPFRGAAVAVRLVRALGGSVEVEGDSLVVRFAE